MLFVTTLILGVSGTYAPATASASMVQKAQTAHYRLMLQIGPEEKMYSKAEVARLHPTSGEVMVSGAMGGMSMHGGMAMDMRHLEVHVYDRASGKVMTSAQLPHYGDTRRYEERCATARGGHVRGQRGPVRLALWEQHLDAAGILHGRGLGKRGTGRVSRDDSQDVTVVPMPALPWKLAVRPDCRLVIGRPIESGRA